MLLIFILVYCKTLVYNYLTLLFIYFMIKFKYYTLLFVFSFIFISCNDDTPQLNSKKADSTDAEEVAMKCDTFINIKYNKVYIKNLAELNKIKADFNYDDTLSPAHRAIITLNRKEFRFFHVKDSIIVPEMVNPDLRAYSVFPECYPGAKSINKIIIVSNKYQSYACYENGKLVRFSAANTGKERTQTYPGRYKLNWRQLVRKSSIDSLWVLPYTLNFHQYAGNAFHHFEMPGRPVSHSCVRQFNQDAKWLYKWAEVTKYDSLKKPIENTGTPVLIIDNFDYSRKRFGPWLDLSSNKDVKLQLPNKPMEYEEALIPICQIPKESRGCLKDRNRYEKAEEILRSRGVIRPNVTLIESVNNNKIRREKKEKAEKEKRLKDSTATN